VCSGFIVAWLPQQSMRACMFLCTIIHVSLHEGARGAVRVHCLYRSDAWVGLVCIASAVCCVVCPWQVQSERVARAWGCIGVWPHACAADTMLSVAPVPLPDVAVCTARAGVQQLQLGLVRPEAAVDRL
jgi:hypothetical protein